MLSSHGIRKASVFAILVAAAGPQAVGAGGGNGSSNYITLQKLEQYYQLSATGTGADPLAPFVFNSASPVSTSFLPPSGSAVVLTNQGGSGGRYQFSQSFGTQAAMDAAYPNGTYTLEVSGASNFTLSLSGNLYPNTPQVTGGGTWNSSGQLVIDPTQNTTINFNTFSGYGTAGVLSHMQLQILSFDNATVTLGQTYITPTNASAFTSYSIPAGTLTPGSIYFCLLEYDTVPSDNTTAVSGDTAVTLYSAQTTFILVTSGTPTNVPTITQQPTSQTQPLGSNVNFQVGYTGGGNSLQVQWFKDGVSLGLNRGGGPSGPTLTLNNIQNSDAGSYFAVLTNGTGPYVQTNTVTLTIGAATSNPPSFLVQPTSQVVETGSAVVFNAPATNSPSYQWQFNGSPLSSGNGVSISGSVLVISSVTASNAGNYACVATNSFGSVQSGTANLSVISTTDIGRLINISCRAGVGTGGNILIAGFAVGGAGTSGTEPLLVRGSGPALAAFGVGGTLPDPQLQINSGSTVLGTNNGWAGNAQVASTAAAVGAFAWSNTSSHDSALLESLSTGPYTAQVSGQSNDTGVALVEVYDATPAGTYTPTMPRLVNISTRVQVGTGGNILIAGFVIEGSTSETVLIRASGPALGAFGVPGTLPDPALSLYSGNTLLGQNNGWGGNPAIVNAAALVGAFAWGNPSSNDSAILVTLPPGAYTAQIAGASGDTGVALIEVYEVP